MFINHFEDVIFLALPFIIVHMILVVSVRWETLRLLNQRIMEQRENWKTSYSRQNYIGDNIYCQQPFSKDIHVAQSSLGIKAHTCTSEGTINFTKSSYYICATYTLFPLPRLLLTSLTFFLCLANSGTSITVPSILCLFHVSFSASLTELSTPFSTLP